MTKHILSIDGGGIRGVLPLALLTEIETRRGPCADLFDIVAGTSIGGIIATGLAHRVPAKTIYDMLMSDGGTIFAKTPVTDFVNLTQAKYDAAPLEGYLAQTFGSAMLWWRAPGCGSRIGGARHSREYPAIGRYTP